MSPGRSHQVRTVKIAWQSIGAPVAILELPGGFATKVRYTGQAPCTEPPVMQRGASVQTQWVQAQTQWRLHTSGTIPVSEDEDDLALQAVAGTLASVVDGEVCARTWLFPGSHHVYIPCIASDANTEHRFEPIALPDAILDGTAEEVTRPETLLAAVRPMAPELMNVRPLDASVPIFKVTWSIPDQATVTMSARARTQSAATHNLEAEFVLSRDGTGGSRMKRWQGLRVLSYSRS